MGVLLALIGGGWAIIGIANIFTSPAFQGTGGDAMASTVVIFNMLSFVLPGLVVFGLGYMISSKNEKERETEKNSVKCPFCAEMIKAEAKPV
jgi:hypothetical protein